MRSYMSFSPDIYSFNHTIIIYGGMSANRRESGAKTAPNAVWGRLSLLNSLVYARHGRELMG